VQPTDLRRRGLGGAFWRYLAALFVFTLGNSTDAFLLLRAADLGVPVALAPVLWAMLHVVKTAARVPGGRSRTGSDAGRSSSEGGCCTRSCTSASRWPACPGTRGCCSRLTASSSG